MTILHKCSKTHGHYLVLLVTSWLRRKAEKCDQICWGEGWGGFGVFPRLRLGLHCTQLAQGMSGTAVDTRPSPSLYGWGWAISSEIPCGPVHRNLLCRQAVPSWALGLALVWGGHGTRFCACCECWDGDLLSGTSPLPSSKALLWTPSACHGGPQPWVVLGVVMSRVEQRIANSRKQVCAWVPDDG